MPSGVTNYGYTYQPPHLYESNKTSKVQEDEISASAAGAASDEVKKEDTFEKSTPSTSQTYKPDMDKVNAMKADLQGNVAAFKKMVQGLFGKQGNLANSASMSQLLNIDKKTQMEAQAAISEDGEWGVNAVAGRILDFAKAISGGDPAKIETLRKAVEDGFAAAEKVWGGSLPGISYDTKDKIMQGFDEWAAEANEGTAAAAKA